LNVCNRRAGLMTYGLSYSLPLTFGYLAIVLLVVNLMF
jgi:hypothetical protein